MNKLSGIIFSPEGLTEGSVYYDGGRITAVTHHPTDTGLFIAPGFIDLHVHGGGGADFLDGTLQAWDTAAEMHASHGTAVLLPTTLTCPDSDLFAAFDIFRAAKKSSAYANVFYGLHLEGPYFSAAQAGAQDPKYLLKPTPEHYEKVLAAGRGCIARMSVAPELEGALALGRRLKEEGICASVGHTDAIYEDVLAAVENGYTHLTHLYSGMSALTRRHGYRFPGVIESGYMIDSLTVEVIADGKHLPLSMLNHVFRAKTPAKVALVTDAMRGAGQTEGKTILGSLENGQECYIEDGVAKMPGGEAFAGSIATTDRLVRTAVAAGAELTDAVKMMSETPARIAGMKHKGVIAPGCDADFTVFTEGVSVCETVSGGKTVYKK